MAMLREAVETLLQDGDVYLTEWANARDVPLHAGTFGLDDYVLVIQRFLRAMGSAALHIVALFTGARWRDVIHPALAAFWGSNVARDRLSSNGAEWAAPVARCRA